MIFTFRVHLAALHFNENSNRDQATTKAGDPRYAISYPKFKKGLPTVRIIKVPITYDYVNDLMTDVWQRRQKYESCKKAIADWILKNTKSKDIGNLVDKFDDLEDVSKEDIVLAHVSRFNIPIK